MQERKKMLWHWAWGSSTDEEPIICHFPMASFCCRMVYGAVSTDVQIYDLIVT